MTGDEVRVNAMWRGFDQPLEGRQRDHTERNVNGLWKLKEAKGVS